MRYRYKALLMCASLLFLLFIIGEASEPSLWLKSAVKASSRLVIEQDPQLEHIKLEAQKLRIAPIDARLDRVWKAIPGYNGVEVDVDQTLQLLKRQKPGDKVPFVMKEVPPAIQLDDLGPQPIYKGNPQKKMVALMINVAWGNEFINPMLDVLRKENVKATFFFDGSWLKKNVETAMRIREEGHELANHAYSHKNMSTLSREQALQEMQKTQVLLKQELGVDNHLFAPPSGDYDQETVRLAQELHMRTILWSLDTVDWTQPSVSSILQKVNARVEPGTMILMHPTSSSSQSLRSMITIIKQKGLALGTVSELISPQRLPEIQKLRE
jgi:probable sporulation protein (polysaccharide deacetylase family)